MACDTCDGYGIIKNENSLMNVDLNTLLRPSKKGGAMSLADAQEYLKKIKSINDTSTHTLCIKCNGNYED